MGDDKKRFREKLLKFIEKGIDSYMSKDSVDTDKWEGVDIDKVMSNMPDKSVEILNKLGISKPTLPSRDLGSSVGAVANAIVSALFSDDPYASSMAAAPAINIFSRGEAEYAKERELYDKNLQNYYDKLLSFNVALSKPYIESEIADAERRYNERKANAALDATIFGKMLDNYVELLKDENRDIKLGSLMDKDKQNRKRELVKNLDNLSKIVMKNQDEYARLEEKEVDYKKAYNEVRNEYQKAEFKELLDNIEEKKRNLRKENDRYRYFINKIIDILNAEHNENYKHWLYADDEYIKSLINQYESGIDVNKFNDTKPIDDRPDLTEELYGKKTKKK